MDIGGTAKKIQRATKVAEESYKKMGAMMERMQEMMEKLQQLQEDMETTSRQVDHIEHDVARQRALVEAMAEEQGLDVEELLASVDVPEPENGSEESDDTATARKATSHPSVNDDS